MDIIGRPVDSVEFINVPAENKDDIFDQEDDEKIIDDIVIVKMSESLHNAKKPENSGSSKPQRLKKRYDLYQLREKDRSML